MTAFPPGGWMLDQVNDFFRWVSEICALSTKESHKLVDPLITLAQCWSSPIRQWLWWELGIATSKQAGSCTKEVVMIGNQLWVSMYRHNLISNLISNLYLILSCLVSHLVTLLQRMRHMGKPESSNDENAPALTAEPSSMIVANPPVLASRVGPAGITYIVNNPPVHFLHPSNHSFLNQTAFLVQSLQTWQTQLPLQIYWTSGYLLCRLQRTQEKVQTHSPFSSRSCKPKIKLVDPIEPVEDESPQRPKSPSLLSWFTKPFRKKSQDQSPEASTMMLRGEGPAMWSRAHDPIPPVPSSSFSQYHDSPGVESLGPSSSVPPFDLSSLCSFRTYSTSSFVSPHDFELELLRQKYRRSQEDLQRECDRTAEQEAMYEHELKARDDCCQRELEILRAQQGNMSGKGKHWLWGPLLHPSAVSHHWFRESSRSFLFYVTIFILSFVVLFFRIEFVFVFFFFFGVVF